MLFIDTLARENCSLRLKIHEIRKIKDLRKFSTIQYVNWGFDLISKSEDKDTSPIYTGHLHSEVSLLRIS